MTSFSLKKSFIFFNFLLFQLYLKAQDTAYNATTNTTSRSTVSEQLWYMQKWVWIAGGAAVLLILLALFSGGGKKDKSRTDRVTITKTVRTETDTDN